MSKWLQAAQQHILPPDKTDFTDKTSDAHTTITRDDSQREVLSVLSVLSGDPNLASPSASPARDLIAVVQSDLDLYAEALRAHGPMSYGQAMDVLGWGATRAGQAETGLRKAGRIEFNRLGRAVLATKGMTDEPR